MSGNQEIKKVSHIHECIINEMLLNPQVMQKELCEMFGYSQSWMARLTNSDSFQARLAERRRELVDPVLAARLNDRLKSAVVQSVDQIQRKLDAGDNADLALQSLGVFAEAAGVLSTLKK
jgi:hypothetical protein